jgi:hypothetical protein
MDSLRNMLQKAESNKVAVGHFNVSDSLARTLSDMPGIEEHGLFIGMVRVVSIARGNDVTELNRGDLRGTRGGNR